MTTLRSEALAAAPAAAPHDGLPVDLIERIRKACTRLGIASGESLEACCANPDDMLYALCSAVDRLFDRAAPAAQAAPAAPSAPSGMRLVPVEPTPKMLAAAVAPRGSYSTDQASEAAVTYKIMLAAAPSAPAEWISVKDRLPKEQEQVAILIAAKPALGVEMAYWNGERFYNADGCDLTDAVSHWLRLPAAPSAGEPK